ncbi:hypothetical protein REPUB_Repub05bG0011800 [Reevesia pubescens]
MMNSGNVEMKYIGDLKHPHARSFKTTFDRPCAKTRSSKDTSHDIFARSISKATFNAYVCIGKAPCESSCYDPQLSSYYYHDSVLVTMKGVDIIFERVLTIFATIDLSSNQFEGEIPEIVGKLTALKVLNFSHNNLTGCIPSTMANLTELESLDLSSNKLVGQIPTQLAGLRFLEVLNLSQNQLVGPIPLGTQFNTFSNDSYTGNLGLCGFPLSKNCGNKTEAETPVFHEDADSESEFEWKVALMGYGSGLVLGISTGYIIFTLGKPKWLVKMVERAGYKLNKCLKGRRRK